MGGDLSFTHINANGDARMVDIGDKPDTVRRAEARAVVHCKKETCALIISGDVPKGDVLACARVAGIMAAKKTPELIPLCHQIPLTSVDMDITVGSEAVIIRASVGCSYKTGAEMEALTAASVAALTVYDMCKAVDKSMVIDSVALLAKSGGASGDYAISQHVI